METRLHHLDYLFRSTRQDRRCSFGIRKNQINGQIWRYSPGAGRINTVVWNMNSEPGTGLEPDEETEKKKAETAREGVVARRNELTDQLLLSFMVSGVHLPGLF